MSVMVILSTNTIHITSYNFTQKARLWGFSMMMFPCPTTCELLALILFWIPFTKLFLPMIVFVKGKA